MPPGYKRSKALWDEARRPGAPRMAFLRAVGYELQPVRFSSFHTVDWQASMQRHSTRFRYWVTDPLPSAIRSLSTVCYRLSTRGWMTLGGILIYFYAIRWIHEALDAGPLVLIISALIAIFTIGLGNNNESHDGMHMSAYSVFNRGFQSIMGSVDVEALVQQHVGGAMGLGAMGMARPEHGQERNDDAPPPRPARRQPRPVPERIHDDDNDNNYEDDNLNVIDQLREQSRKSGKKARRGNLEQRRELQRQRQAAIAMGFGGDGGHEEQLAMQQILEEQIAANVMRGHE